MAGRKAVEDHRTPRRCRAPRRPVPREASWSAPALWRFLIHKPIRREVDENGLAVGCNSCCWRIGGPLTEGSLADSATAGLNDAIPSGLKHDAAP